MKEFKLAWRLCRLNAEPEPEFATCEELTELFRRQGLTATAAALNGRIDAT